MATFVLPQHAEKGILKKLLHGFQERLDASGRGSSLLSDMNEALANRTSHCLIYWPLKNDEWHTKTCIYDQTYERGKASALCFHLVYLTTLLARMNKTVTRFLDCECHNHTRDILFDWQEFVYPQFVQFMIKRRSLLGDDERTISAPPTPPSPLSLSNLVFSPKETATTTTAAIDHDDDEYHHIELRVKQHFLSLPELANDAFSKPCATLLEAHQKEVAVAQFGVEQLMGARYFPMRRVTNETHKLFFQMSNVKVRAPHIGNGAIELKACSKEEPPYILLAINFTLRMPLQNGHKVYQFYLPRKVARPRVMMAPGFDQRRRIESRDLCGENELCMIVSRAPLRIEFKEHSLLLLVTSGVCKFDLQDACLDMWTTRENTIPWPLAYEIEQVARPMPFKETERRYYFERLHATYHDLFQQTFVFSRPCIGHVTFERASLYDTVVSTSVGFINQYGTMHWPNPSRIGEKDKKVDLKSLRVYFTKESGELPLFFTGDGKPLVLVKETYFFAQKPYVIYGLSLKKNEPVLCFFLLNRRRDYLLIIPVIYQ